MVFSKDMESSLRSLNSLQVLPPPSSSKTDKGRVNDNDNTEEDPFSSSPYAPHMQPVVEMRDDDDGDCRAPTNNDERQYFGGTSIKKETSTKDDTIPVLTKGRLELHLKQSGSGSDSLINRQVQVQESYNKSSTTKSNNQKHYTMKTHIRPSVSRRFNRSNSNSQHQKIFMIGTTKVYPRSIIPPTIYQNKVTELWVVNINNNANANDRPNKKSEIFSSRRKMHNNVEDSSSLVVKSFSFRSEKEACAYAYANSPPVMIPFDKHKSCCLCSTKFTLLFKRPRHCRNCGIIICSNYKCSTTWPVTMLPETYNQQKKNESVVNVCTSCNILHKRFKHALVNGRYGTVVELYRTGNVNLRTLYALRGEGAKNKKNDEAMYPIHYAIQGHSEKLVKWLIDVQHCPIFEQSSTGNDGSSDDSVVSSFKTFSTDIVKSLSGSNATKKDNMSCYTPTLKTSKGRSVMDLALKTQHVGILRYLINDKNASVYEVKDLELALGALNAMVKAMPVNEDDNMFVYEDNAVGLKN